MTIEKEYDELKKENRKLKKQLAILEDLKLENEQLKRELEKCSQKEECAYVLKNNIGDVIFYCDKENSIVACYKTFEEARRVVFEFIESWYNRKRIHSSINYRTPEEIEKQAV